LGPSGAREDAAVPLAHVHQGWHPSAPSSLGHFHDGPRCLCYGVLGSVPLQGGLLLSLQYAFLKSVFLLLFIQQLLLWPSSSVAWFAWPNSKLGWSLLFSLPLRFLEKCSLSSVSPVSTSCSCISDNSRVQVETRHYHMYMCVLMFISSFLVVC
jgi:hypothetical protein